MLISHYTLSHPRLLVCEGGGVYLFTEVDEILLVVVVRAHMAERTRSEPTPLVTKHPLVFHWNLDWSQFYTAVRHFIPPPPPLHPPHCTV